MMRRREMLKLLPAGGLWALTGQTWAARPTAGLRIGACMVNLQEAKQAGLEGVEVRAGNAADTLEIADPAVQQKYKDQMRETGLPISSLMMGLLNSYPLASDPRGPAWLEQSIAGAKAVGAKVILVAFFGKGNLLDENKQLKRADVDVVVKRLKVAAPRAADAGVTLAIENTLSAQQNIEIVERVGHKAVSVYYDVGNSTKNGYDVPAEIRLLGKRISQFHFKDNPHYLGEGPVQFAPIAAAVRDIGYQGWIVLETTSPSKDKVADARRNGAFVRKLFQLG
jgi:L-ribulose-5-phosphate 3-epimerase